MSKSAINRKEALHKLGIKKMNHMQDQSYSTIKKCEEVVLLSPTGTGKTVAFLMPLLEKLDRDETQVQLLILVPFRELAIQIEQVIRKMGTGFKVNAVYGGKTRSKDKLDLKHTPSILVGTPGRINDHLEKKNFSADAIKTLVLDEFDKSLQVGFEPEMKEIMRNLPALSKKVLTSATHGVQIPKFVGVKKPVYIDFLEDKKESKLILKRIISPEKDKREMLFKSLKHLKEQRGIVFCNFKDTINYIAEYLEDEGVSFGVYYGGLEQNERELALVKFRNGTHRLIIATDLAARGLDIPEIDYIIHYQLPPHEEEFTHRNGRTARMHQDGTAYVMQWEEEELPEFIPNADVETITDEVVAKQTGWHTLLITGGRKDKISKGDIAGLFFKQGNLSKDEVGMIELKQDCAYIGIKAKNINKIVNTLNNSRLKKKKVRIRVV